MRKKTVENCYLKLAFIKSFPWKIHNNNYKFGLFVVFINYLRFICTDCSCQNRRPCEKIKP